MAVLCNQNSWEHICNLATGHGTTDIMTMFQYLMSWRLTCVDPTIASVTADHGAIGFIIVVHFETHWTEVALSKVSDDQNN